MIKSNNPHLRGGEKTLSFRFRRFLDIDNSKFSILDSNLR